MSLQGVDYEVRCMRLEAEIERLRAGYCKQHSHLLPDMGCWVCRAQGAESRMEAALAIAADHFALHSLQTTSASVIGEMVKALKGGE